MAPKVPRVFLIAVMCGAAMWGGGGNNTNDTRTRIIAIIIITSSPILSSPSLFSVSSFTPQPGQPPGQKPGVGERGIGIGSNSRRERASSTSPPLTVRHRAHATGSWGALLFQKMLILEIPISIFRAL